MPLTSRHTQNPATSRPRPADTSRLARPTVRPPTGPPPAFARPSRHTLPSPLLMYVCSLTPLSLLCGMSGPRGRLVFVFILLFLHFRRMLRKHRMGEQQEDRGAAMSVLWLLEWTRPSDECVFPPPVSCLLRSMTCLLYFSPPFLSS